MGGVCASRAPISKNRALVVLVVAVDDLDPGVHAVEEVTADVADDQVTSGHREPERVGAVHVARCRQRPAIGERRRSAGVHALCELLPAAVIGPSGTNTPGLA